MQNVSGPIAIGFGVGANAVTAFWIAEGSSSIIAALLFRKKIRRIDLHK